MLFINALVDCYSEDELRRIVDSSKSMKEVLRKLGYKTQNGSNRITVKKRLTKFNISTSHFESVDKTERTYENVFCKDSTATQHTLREWYKKFSDDSKCSICGQNKLWNGCELTMILDHINGDNHDNTEDNLRWICPNCNSQLDTFAGRNIKKKLDKKINSPRIKTAKQKKKICPICNINEISITSKMCKECRSIDRRKNTPSKEELEKLIYDTPFTQIGKLYEVSDNAVRKWCKFYSLPFTYKELHKSGV